MKDLDCSGNELIDLDLSDCTNLTKLHCNDNRITDLNSFLTIRHPEKLTWLDVRNNHFYFNDFPLHLFSNIKTIYRGNVHDNIWIEGNLKNSLEVGGEIYSKIWWMNSTKLNNAAWLWVYRMFIAKIPTFVGGSLAINNHPYIGSILALSGSALEVFATPRIEKWIKDTHQKRQENIEEDIKNWNNFLDSLKKERKKIEIELGKLGYKMRIKDISDRIEIELFEKAIDGEKIFTETELEKNRDLKMLKVFLEKTKELPNVIELQLDDKNKEETKIFIKGVQEIKGNNISQIIKNLHREREMDNDRNRELKGQWKNAGFFPNDWTDIGLTLEELDLVVWLRDKKSKKLGKQWTEPQWIANNADLEELREEYQEHLEGEEKIKKWLEKKGNDDAQIKELIIAGLTIQNADLYEEASSNDLSELEEKIQKREKEETIIDVPSVSNLTDEELLKEIYQKIYELKYKKQVNVSDEFIIKYLGKGALEELKRLQKTEAKIEIPQ